MILTVKPGNSHRDRGIIHWTHPSCSSLEYGTLFTSIQREYTLNLRIQIETGIIPSTPYTAASSWYWTPTQEIRIVIGIVRATLYSIASHWIGPQPKGTRIEIGIMPPTPLYHIPQQGIDIELQPLDSHWNRYNVFNSSTHGEPLILDSNHGNWHQKGDYASNPPIRQWATEIEPEPREFELKLVLCLRPIYWHRTSTPAIRIDTGILCLHPPYTTASHWYWNPTPGFTSELVKSMELQPQDYTQTPPILLYYIKQLI